jgi:hypothetical protein
VNYVFLTPMKKPVLLGSLVLANIVLAGWLLAGVKSQSPSQPGISSATNRVGNGMATSKETQDSTNSEPSTSRLKNSRGGVAPPLTAFAKVYSSDPNQFAANLRAIHCPEETIKDILTAEVHRWYQAQEDALRPTPADHVPFAWSARTAEPKLIERRQKASAVAREESTLLHGALSCDVNVPVPLYALTSSDQQVEAAMAASPNSCAIREIQDAYWAGVYALQGRTKGFWLRAEVEELEQLKAQRKQALAGLFPGQ